jgi:UDP-glucose 4-epimerase
MKVLVTGGAGFIGSHLVDDLIQRGADVHIIDNLIMGKRENVHPKACLHKVDICSKEAKQIIIEQRPDVIFHLAAQADVGKSISDPNYDASVNIIGTINLLEASKEALVKKVIFASTAAVYGNLNKECVSEEDPESPISYYGLSKYTAESYIQLFYQLYGLSYTILRYANVYGPRQLPKGDGGVVSVFLNQINNGDMMNVHGDGEQSRDFIYVKDIVEANIAAIERGHQETIQVSTAQRTSINDLLGMLEYIHGSPLKTRVMDERVGDIKHSFLDNSKARNLLIWSPKFDILSGLIKTYNESFRQKFI